MEKDKKIIAALSGVLAMIESEPVESYIEPKAGNYPSPWAAHGKYQTMQYRDISQRRLIKRNR